MSGALKAGDRSVIQVDEGGVIVTLFLRPDKTIDELDKQEKSIFIQSVPIYWTEEAVKTLFAACGKIKECTYVDGKKAHLSGYRVTFKEAAAVERALSMVYKTVRSLKVETFKEWIPESYKRYMEPRLKPDRVIAECDKFVTEYLEQQEEVKKQEKELTEPDDEGWVTVTKQSRKAKFRLQGKGSIRKLNRLKKKTAEKELLKYYQFKQIPERKEATLLHLLQDEKNRRLEKINQRRFRPY